MDSRTKIQWINSIKDPLVRKQAKENYRKALKPESNIPFSKPHFALNGAFEWYKTPEGMTYWGTIYNTYRNAKNLSDYFYDKPLDNDVEDLFDDLTRLEEKFKNG